MTASTGKGTFKQLNDGKFVSNNSFDAFFKQCEEYGYVRCQTTAAAVNLTKDSEVNVVTLESGNKHRKLVLTTVADGKVEHWMIVVACGTVMACPSLAGPIDAVFSFKWVPAASNVAEDVLKAFGDDPATVPTAAVKHGNAMQRPARHQVNLDGDRGDTYRVTFDDVASFEYLQHLMEGCWIKAAYSIIDKQGMRFPGDSVDVAISEVNGEQLITFLRHDSNCHYYRVCENTGRASPVMTVPEFKTSTVTAMFFVTMLTGFQEKPQVPDTERLSWIPQFHQYVEVEGEKELYRITDFDAVEKKFIVKKADSTRAGRGLVTIGSHLARTDDGTGFMVDAKHLRPFVLTYVS